MGEQKNIAAIFDFDGTLFKGHFWSGVVKHHVRHNVKLPQVSVYVVSHILLWMVSKFKIVSDETYKIRWGEDLASLFKGLSKEEGLEIFRWIRSNYVLKALRMDMMALLQRHSNEGHIILLLSGSFSDFLETLREKLDVDYIVGTKLEMANNVYSGKIVKPLCFGRDKARLLRDFLKHTRPDIDPGLSFAYTDSILDVPILEMVGNPVAAYPDRELLSLAHQRGWQVLPTPGM